MNEMIALGSVAVDPEPLVWKHDRSRPLAGLNRRMALWLADRAAGTNGSRPQETTVKFIPHTPEEREAWRRRRASDTGKKNPVYATWNSAEEAYTGRRRAARKPITPNHKGLPATTTETAPVSTAGEGEDRKHAPSPAGPSESGSQADGSKRHRSSPSGSPAHARRRRRAPMRRRNARFDPKQLGEQIATFLGL